MNYSFLDDVLDHEAIRDRRLTRPGEAVPAPLAADQS